MTPRRAGSSTAAAAAVLLLLALLVCFAPHLAVANDDDGFCHTAEVDLKGYEQYYVPSITNGDRKGDYFVFGRDQLIDQGYAVQKIRVWVGERYVTGIELTLTDGTYELWGHKNGSPASYEFNGDETVTEWKQYKSKNGADYIAGIVFHTSLGNTFKKIASEAQGSCRIGCDDCLQRSIGSGIFAGLSGYVYDGNIASLTPYFVHTIKGMEMTNMTYPVIEKAPPAYSTTIYDYSVTNPTLAPTAIATDQIAVTEKRTTQYTLSTTFKFGMSYTEKVGVSGESPLLKSSVELSTTYYWELSLTATKTLTYEKSVTNTQTFNFICPACTACRFIVSQGVGSLSDLYNDFTATYTTTLDTGATLVYTVTGRAPTDNISPVTQTIMVEPLTNVGYCAKAVAAAPAAAAGTTDANGVVTYPVGGKPLPMYRKCGNSTSGRKLCKKGGKVPALLMKGATQALMMSRADLQDAQKLIPAKPGYYVVDYAAPFTAPNKARRAAAAAPAAEPRTATAPAPADGR